MKCPGLRSVRLSVKNKIVISASRRSDIPAFYLNWFMDRLARGCFEVTNPYNQRVSVIPAGPDAVHTIVFWSKDFETFLAEGVGEKLRQRGYNLFFNFTINSTSAVLEPNLPPLADRLEQLDQLSRRFGPQTVNWRFDPICFYRLGQGPLKNNLNEMNAIADRAQHAGITRCITSFVDLYPKIRRRPAPVPGFAFVDPPPEEKAALLMALENRLHRRQINLHTCCEKEIIEHLPATTTIRPSACIPNRHLLAVYGGAITLKKDYGQRVRQGCGCRVSVDIGSYRDQICHHGCLYCYANPTGDNRHH